MAATIKQVAHRAGVSVGTVSNVLGGMACVSDGLRERVLAAVRDLDYHPNHAARSLKIRQTHMLGLVISDITNPFFPQLMRGAEDAAWRSGYVLTTFNSDEQLDREKQILSVLRHRNVDGILMVLSADNGDLSHVTQAADTAPVVCLDRVPRHAAWDSVSCDNAGGARECVTHLVSLGHRRIAILAGSPGLWTGRERLRGYRQALKAAGIRPDPALIRNTGFRHNASFRESQALMRLPDPPTAIFSSNFTVALGLLDALASLGLRPPEDVAVATFDDLPILDAIRPRLTAVAQPAYDIGFRGADLLIQRIQGKLGPDRQRIVLPARLLVRDSTAPPPARP